MDTNLVPPRFGPRQPVYPPTQQLLRVTGATVPGPGVGSSSLVPGTNVLYVAFAQQLRTDSLTTRDREPCLAVDPSGGGLSAGYYLGRLAGSWTGLPVYEALSPVGVVQYLQSLVENIFQSFITNLTVNNLTVVNNFYPPIYTNPPWDFPTLCAAGKGGLMLVNGVLGLFLDCCWYPATVGSPTCYPGPGAPIPGGVPPGSTPGPGGGGWGGPPLTGPSPTTGTNSSCSTIINVPAACLLNTIYVVASGFGDDGSGCAGGCDSLNGSFPLTFNPHNCNWQGSAIFYCPNGFQSPNGVSFKVQLTFSAGMYHWAVSLCLGTSGSVLATWSGVSSSVCTLPVTIVPSATFSGIACLYPATSLVIQSTPGASLLSPPIPAGSTNEITVTCCDDGGTLPATLSATAQYRIHNSGAGWTTVTPSAHLTWKSGSLWSNQGAGELQVQLGNGATSDLTVTCCGSAPSGVPFCAFGAFIGKTIVGFGSNVAFPNPTLVKATVSQDTGGSYCGSGTNDGILVEVDGIDGSAINKTTGTLYDVRFTVTR